MRGSISLAPLMTDPLKSWCPHDRPIHLTVSRYGGTADEDRGAVSTETYKERVRSIEAPIRPRPVKSGKIAL